MSRLTEWFRHWLKVKGIEDPDGVIVDELVRSNRRKMIIRLIQVAVAFGAVPFLMGWMRGG